MQCIWAATNLAKRERDLYTFGYVRWDPLHTMYVWGCHEHRTTTAPRTSSYTPHEHHHTQPHEHRTTSTSPVREHPKNVDTIRTKTCIQYLQKCIQYGDLFVCPHGQQTCKTSCIQYLMRDERARGK